MKIPKHWKLPPPIHWWLIWIALLAGPFVLLIVLGGNDSLLSAPPFPWQLSLIPFAISGVIRWGVIPKISNGVIAYPLFVVGIALSEVPSVFGLILFPALRQDLFILTVIGMAQYVPFFAKRFYPEK